MAVSLRRKYEKEFDVGRKWYHSASSVPYSTPSNHWHVGKVVNLMGLVRYSCCSQMVFCFALTNIFFMDFSLRYTTYYWGRVE